MDSERFRRLREIFDAGVEKPASERSSFLDDACAGDAALRDEVQRLLDRDDHAGHFTGLLGSDVVGEFLDAPAASLSGTSIGSYRLHRLIAAGGMGMVYEGTQQQPHRVVAVKIMRSGISTPAALRRFEYESEILARLHHPGIAHIYEAGTHRSRDGDEITAVPFFAMELIKGARTILEWARDETVSTQVRLELFVKVCDAVHHAHQKGIVHRDLKPGNILVDAAGQPKIIDFGVARATDLETVVATAHTQAGQIVGTIQYMSPEQLSGNPDDVDTRSDVHALGLVLFELLCGQLPYDLTGRPLTEMAHIIRETPPRRPSAIVPSLAGDLDWIILKALEKDRARRYASAAELAADIARHLNHEPVTAGPPSARYRLAKFVRRHRVAAIAAVLVAVSIIAGSIEMTLGLVQAKHAEARADARRKEAERESWKANAVVGVLSDALASADPHGGGRRDVLVLELVDHLAETIPTAFAEQPEIEATLRRTLGQTYIGLGLYDRAEVHLQRALELDQQTLPAGHPDVIQATISLADLRSNQGLLNEAEALHRQNLQDLRGAGRGDDHSALQEEVNLAMMQYQQGKLDDAEKQARRTLDRCHRLLGEENSVTLNSMCCLTDILLIEGRLAEAEPLVMGTLEGRRRLLGELDHATIDAMDHLAELLLLQAKFTEAEKVFRDIVDLRSTVEGKQHRITMVATNNLVLCLGRVGKYEEAESLGRAALAVQYRILREDHPDIMVALSNLADALNGQGKLTEAEWYARQAYELAKRVHGEEHRNTLAFLDQLGWILEKQERLVEAEACYREANELAEVALPEGSVDIPCFQLHWGSCLAKLKRYPDAASLLLESYATLESMLGREHKQTRDAIAKLVSLYSAWGKRDEAARYQALLAKPAGSESR